MSIRGVLGEFKRSVQTTRDQWPEEKRIRVAMEQYKKAQGYSFDIHNPQLFTEKIVWYKLFYKKPDLQRIVDKYLFKGYIEERMESKEYTIPLYGVWETVDSLRKAWSNLPEEFCLKSTLMSDSRGIIMVHDKSSTDLDGICREVVHWLKPYNTLINSFCRAYYGTKPRIIAEEFMSEIDEQLYDYKFLCFDGVPKYIYTYKNRFSEGDNASEDYELTYYDIEWKKQDAVIGGHKNGNAPKPKHFEEMIEIAQKLSSGLPFVRVVFYEFRNRVYVGEMTLYPHGGLLSYEPKAFNQQLGNDLILPLSNG